MLSIILYGRNDSHGYNLHKRGAISLNAIAEVLTAPNDEILFVDYNTPDDLPTFVEAIQDTLTDKAKQVIRVLRVRPFIHERFKDKTHLVALEPISRNIAVRRSNAANRWILSTNTDMIFVPRKEGASLSNIVADLPDGFYQLPRFELPETLWESFDRRDARGIIEKTRQWGHRFHLNDVVYGSDTILYDAPGDFQLALRDDIFAIDGFHEEMILGWHVDSNFTKRMTLLRGKIDSALPRLFGYHCDHTRQATLMHGRDRVENDSRRFVDGVKRAELPEQRAHWGLPDAVIEEIDLRDSIFDRYIRAMQGAVPAASGEYYESVYAERSYNDLSYVPEHVIPYLCDQLSTMPREQNVLFAGCRPRMLELLLSVWTGLGFTGRILVPDDVDWFPTAGKESTKIAVGPLQRLIEDAGFFIFEFGCGSQTSNGALARLNSLSLDDRDRLAFVREAFIRASARELELRAQTGALPRRFIAINVIHNDFEPLISDTLSFTYTPFSSRIRHGYVVPDEQVAAAQLDPRSVAAWLRKALDRSQPVPLQEASRLLGILQEVADLPPDQPLHEDVGALAVQLKALLGVPQIRTLIKMSDAAFASLPMRIEQARPSVRLARDVQVAVGPAQSISGPRYGFASLADWEDPQWFAHARRHFGGRRAYMMMERSQWFWERVSIIHGLEVLGRLHAMARVLVIVTSGDDLLAALSTVAHEVHVIGAAHDTDGFLVGAPYSARNLNKIFNSKRLKFLDSGREIKGNWYDAVVIPHGAIGLHNLTGMSILLNDAERALKPGGVIAFTIEVSLEERDQPGKLPAKLMNENGLALLIEKNTGLVAVGAPRYSAAPEILDRTDRATLLELKLNHFVNFASGSPALGSLWLFQKKNETSSSRWRLLRVFSDVDLSKVWERMRVGPHARLEGGNIVIRKEQPEGIFFFGPYLSMPPGRYRANIKGTVSNAPSPGSNVMAIDVVLDADYRLADRVVTARDFDRGFVEIDFEVPTLFGLGSGSGATLEVRGIHFEAADIAISDVAFSLVDEEVSVDA